jgi:hypothetical protein
MIGISPSTLEEMLSFDICDDALEAAACVIGEKANFTLAGCTGLSECPA